jgi:Site-specific recombinase XerD
MNATVNVVCYKSKVLSNGEHPLMLRICKDGKKKYQSLKLSISSKYWDFDKEKPKRNCPNRDFIEGIISASLDKFRKQIIELKVEGKDYSAQSLVNGYNGNVISRTVGDFYKKLLEDMEQSGKCGNRRICESSYNSLKAFTSNKMDFLFSEIDVLWLNNYEQWLIKRGNKGTTISIQFRTLRAVYNKAIVEKCVAKSYYPFDEFKISKFDTTTQKRAISKEDVAKIMSVNLSDSRQKFARDVFVFSYLCGGINFVDIANLKASNIIDGRCSYIRHKTNKPMSVDLLPEAQKIIERYSQIRTDNYLFPILEISVHKTEKQKQVRIHNLLYQVDKQLKNVAKLANVNTHLTTYVARHSFATVLKRSGVSTSIISESLGHSSEKITQIYLDSFDNSQMKDAMRNLL